MKTDIDEQTNLLGMLLAEKHDNVEFVMFLIDEEENLTSDDNRIILKLCTKKWCGIENVSGKIFADFLHNKIICVLYGEKLNEELRILVYNGTEINLGNRCFGNENIILYGVDYY